MHKMNKLNNSKYSTFLMRDFCGILIDPNTYTMKTSHGRLALSHLCFIAFEVQVNKHSHVFIKVPYYPSTYFQIVPMTITHASTRKCNVHTS